MFTALAINRYLHATTKESLKTLITTLKPLQDVTIKLGSQHVTATPQLTPQAKNILKSLGH